MKIQELGHAVLNVGDVERSRRFYRDVLGFNEVFAAPGGPVAFSGGRTHHELMLFQAPDGSEASEAHRVGVEHLAFKIGTTDEELRDAFRILKEEGVEIVRTLDHGSTTHSIYFLDPDGNQLEVFIDVQPEYWRDDPTAPFGRPTVSLEL